MRTRGPIALLLTILLLLAAGPAAAIGSGLRLGYTPIPAGSEASVDALIQVEFRDDRSARRGGDDPTHVGDLITGLGPTEISTRDHDDVEQTLSRMGADLIRGAGYSVADKGTAGASTLVLTVDELWLSNESLRITAEVEIDLALIPPGASMPTWTERIKATHGATHNPVSQIHTSTERAFLRGLDEWAGLALAKLSGSAAANALRSAAASEALPTSATPPPSSSVPDPGAPRAAQPQGSATSPPQWRELLDAEVVVTLHNGLEASGRLVGADAQVFVRKADGRMLTFPASDVADVQRK